MARSLGLLFSALLATSVHAETISLNFVRGSSGASPLAADEQAGVVPAGNWNNAPQANAGSLTGFALVDDSGTVTTATADWQSGGSTWSGGTSGSGGAADKLMMTGYLDQSGDGAGQVHNITIRNIPYAEYDVYLYHSSSGGANRSARYRANSIDLFTRNLDPANTFNGFVNDQHATLADSNSSASGGNYVRWERLSGATLAIEGEGIAPGDGGHPDGGEARRAPIQGIQIVQVVTIPGLPEVENDEASAVTPTSATANGNLVSNGDGADSATLTIYWGTIDSGTSPGTWANSTTAGTRDSPGTFSTSLTGLQPNTTYFYRSQAVNSAGADWAPVPESFTTPALPPSVENIPANEVAAITGTVGANVTSSGGEPPTVMIYYGTSDGQDSAGAWQQSRSLGIQAGAASVPLAGLAPDTTYYFRAHVQNSGGNSWASTSESFTTLSVTAPVIENLLASAITGTSASLRGEVLDTGLDTPNVTIHYGLTDGGTDEGAWSHSVSVGPDANGFSKFVGGLTPLSTYYYTASATNLAGTVWAGPALSFTTTAEIPNEIVINEIHYDPEPKTERVEFIELYNAGATTTDLSGWKFNAGISFTFPDGTTLDPGQYLVISENPSDFNDMLGFTPLGPWIGALSNDGERIRLVNAGNVIQDEVDYGVGFPWPTGSLDSGRSIELLHPALDNDLGGHWRVAGAEPTGDGTPIPSESTWSYLKGTEEPSPVTGEWRQINFPETGWLSGKGAIGYGEEFITTILADMQGEYSTVYLRREFDVPDPAAIASLVLRARYDDGFNAWINGTRVAWDNVSAEDLPHTATSLSTDENLSYREFVLPHPQGYLVAGTNVIAVQLANTSLSGSSDAFWDAELVTTAASGGSSPGSLNGSFTDAVPPATRQVKHEPEQPGSSDPVVVSCKVTDPNGVQLVQLAYQIVSPGNYIRLSDAAYEDPANWTTITMSDNGSGGDVLAGDDTFTATIPASVQVHRRLIRYRITVEDGSGNSVLLPYSDDPQPNFAYFTYDGNPGWTGQHQPSGGTPTVFSPELLDSVPTYHLITRRDDHEDSQHIPDSGGDGYTGDEYLWEGTLVFEGKVYDHINYRARGGVWRYAMGKNMWKFRFGDGHRFEARDNYGKKYPEPWRRLNFSAIIQQGNYGQRGEQGLYEGVGFRLFELASVEACKTHYINFRIIENASELGADQYSGDFQGLYLVIEQPDGRFLNSRDMPESNIFKMEAGSGELKYQAGPNLPADGSDLDSFLDSYNGGTRTEEWWQENLDLDRYYSYRSIVEAIRHYDISSGKNYYYFHNSETGKWQVHPWDLDLTWKNTFGAGNEPFRSRVLVKPAFDLAYQNRLREILDLLYNDDQAHRLVEEQMSFVFTPGQPSLVDADRFMWDYNPILESSYVNSSKAGHGRYYQSASRPGGFEGMGQQVKEYVVSRRAWIQSTLLDLTPPDTPAITSVGPPGFPVGNIEFESSAFSGQSMVPDAIEWRIGEVHDPVNTPLDYIPGTPYIYEIEPLWESGVQAWNGTSVRQVIPVSTPIPSRTYRARVRHRAANGSWSSWSPALEFVTGAADVTDYQAGLVVSELMYHPRDATPTEIGSGFTDSDFEFIELYNTGAITLGLAGLQFTEGITFSFAGAAVTTLAPGERVLVVRNIAAFQSRYGVGLPIGGEYLDTAFSNGGERVELSLGSGTPILAFTYDDQLPWPPGADDGVNGFSLVLIDPDSVPDHDVAANWTAGEVAGGTPGASELQGIDQWIADFGLSDSPDEDPDKDGLPILLEYALAGGNPLVSNAATLPTIRAEGLDLGDGPKTYAVFAARVRSGLDDVTITVEASSSLNAWSRPGEAVLFEQIDHDDGTTTLRYRSQDSIDHKQPQLFMRLVVELISP